MKSLSNQSTFTGSSQAGNITNAHVLKTNPFYTYRDPETGHWITVISTDLWSEVATERHSQRTRILDATST